MAGGGGVSLSKRSPTFLRQETVIINETLPIIIPGKVESRFYFDYVSLT